MIHIPGGATSRVQPLDVVINKPYKNYVRELFEKHIDENLEAYVEGALSVAKSDFSQLSGLLTSGKIKKQPDMVDWK